MASIEQDRATIESVLCEIARFYRQGKERILTVFDRTNDQYVLVSEGWDGYERLHRTWVHVELNNGKFWIQKDGTQDGIAPELLAAGIPKERIILAFQHQTRREAGDFAVA